MGYRDDFNKSLQRFSNKNSSLSLKDFEILEELGRGATGIVHKAKLLKPELLEEASDEDPKPEFYAIKQIKITKKSEDIIKEV